MREYSRNFSFYYSIVKLQMAASHKTCLFSISCLLRTFLVRQQESIAITCLITGQSQMLQFSGWRWSNSRLSNDWDFTLQTIFLSLDTSAHFSTSVTYYRVSDVLKWRHKSLKHWKNWRIFSIGVIRGTFVAII